MFFRKKQNPPHAFITTERSHVMEKNYTTLCKKGYEQNVIVYRCINLIAKNAASVPLVLYDGDHEVTSDHPLKTLMQNPSHRMNYHSFMESLISYYLLSGNTYAAFNPIGKTGRFLFLRPDHVSIITNDLDVVTHYRYDDEKTYKADHVLHIKTFHPRHHHYGQSPLEAAMFAIEHHNAIAHHNISLMRNGGRPSGALLAENADFTPMQREEIKRELNQLYMGENNAGRILLLEGGFKWIELGLSPKDMDFLHAQNKAAAEIATCFGISPLLVGLMDHASYSNYKEARMQFWEDTVLPLLTKVVSELNVFLQRFYGTSFHFKYNTDHISALTEQHDAIWRKLNECTFLSDNEKREAVGYSPVLSLSESCENWEPDSEISQKHAQTLTAKELDENNANLI